MIKNKRIDVRLTDKDYLVIAKKAELCGMTVSEFVRESALNRKVAGYKANMVQSSTEPIKGQQVLAVVEKVADPKPKPVSKPKTKGKPKTTK